LIRSIIKVVDPKIGETVYDPACGSAGFLCEAFLYMKDKIKSVSDHETLQKKTFYGKEKKGLPYIIATMNMIFHGVSAPNITHGNTLAMNLSQIQESDRKNVILANPPFGGNERGEVLQNFEIRTSETAYMFMQHFIKMLKAGGRAGIVIKNTFLSNGDATALRRKLLDECNLHTVLDLPSGVFTGAGVKTVVLFFTKGEPTQKIWYYQIDKHFTKTQPMTDADLADFLAKQKTREDSEYSWSIDVSELGDDLDLSVKNPHKVEEVDERTPQEVFDNIMSLGSEADEILGTIQEEFWKDDIDDVFGFVDEDSDDYIIHHCLTEEEKAEYDALLEQVDELQEKFFEANPEDQDRLRLEIRELYGKAEDLVNQYKKDDESSEEDEA
jgi:type I restriction enzyme M protein